MARIDFMASEEISFENIDDGRTDDNGRTKDGRRMPAYTISSRMSLRLIRELTFKILIHEVLRT